MIGRLESVDSKVAMASRGSMARASVFSSKSKASGVLSPQSSTLARKSMRSKSGTKDSGRSGGDSKASSSMGDDYLIREGSNSSDKFIVGVIGATLMIVQVVALIAGLTSWLKVTQHPQTLAPKLKGRIRKKGFNVNTKCH
ncbi:unnamed protein product [Durusdinium trenchii]|uniref:Uncharacterized protein n=1 Tax=Durusdinium trenchii TaxID=1381693 RepID=A0ABP0R512_9DINO